VQLPIKAELIALSPTSSLLRAMRQMWAATFTASLREKTRKKSWRSALTRATRWTQVARRADENADRELLDSLGPVRPIRRLVLAR
jgi:hypothetical protein